MMLLKRLKSDSWLQVLLWLLLLESIHCDCRFPKKKIPNGQYLYANKNDAEEIMAPDLYVLKFKCFDGFSRIGPKFIQCVDGKWTDVVTICQRMQCPDPPNVENANNESQSGIPRPISIGTVVTYSCKVGYELSDVTASNLVCTSDPGANQAVWTGKVPLCQEKKICPDPGISKFGRRQGNCCFSGEVLRFSCLEDYEMVGSKEIMCLSTGRWSSARPLCRPLEVHCEIPPDVPHGVVIGENGGDYFFPYEEAEILCEPGYRHRGPTQSVMCEEDGEWEDEFGECTEIYCDPPEPISNGTIPELLTTNLTIFPYNFEITYGCNDGFRLLGGDSWRFCGKNGWSGTTPHCEEIRCPDPGVPEHGDREGNSFEIGAKVRFVCFTGYNLLGSFERYCMPNGQWTGELARCDTPVNYCPNPGIPISGFKNSSSYEIGDKVGFRCQPGYIHLGSKVRECLPNSTWSGAETKCIGPYDFDNRAQISEILKYKVAETFDEENEERKRYQQILQQLTFNGTAPSGRMLDLSYQGRLVLHFAFDVSGSVGQHNFQRSIDFAKAIVKKVGISEDGTRVGALVFSSEAKYEILPMQLKTTEEVLSHLDEIKYIGGGTSATSALNLIKENIELEENYLDKKNKKDVVFIITDGKTNMGGSPEVEAEALKKGGVDIYCIGITGEPRLGTLHKIASTSKYGNEERPNVFVLQNYTTMSWLVQEITNGTLDYSQCGLGMENKIIENRGRILDGDKSFDPWPWMAALFFVPRNWKTLEEAELQCGGSIIHENFILTAAHCMYDEDWVKKEIRLRDKKEIIVKLGLTNVKDETLVQDFGVKTMHIHKRFHPGTIGARLYDYDIAVLQLDRSIEYSPYIRPVCLPPKVLPENSPLYNSSEFGFATGWGHGKAVNPYDKNVRYTISQNLKEIRLPIQSNERCIKSMEKKKFDVKYFTDRMFCAGDGETGNDTCKGDSGGPFMQSQMNSDGYLYWTQVGIISWGIGCGMEKTYGFYTHVQNFTSWIDEKINGLNVDGPK